MKHAFVIAALLTANLAAAASLPILGSVSLNLGRPIFIDDMADTVCPTPALAMFRSNKYKPGCFTIVSQSEMKKIPIFFRKLSKGPEFQRLPFLSPQIAKNMPPAVLSSFQRTIP